MQPHSKPLHEWSAVDAYLYQNFSTSFIGYQGFDCLTAQHSCESSQLYARNVTGNKSQVNLVTKTVGDTLSHWCSSYLNDNLN